MKDCFFKQAKETSILYNFVSAFEGGCTRCTLSNSNKPIIYRGNPESKILLIGEAPGMVEEEDGKPFVGPAGKLLDKIFSAIDIDTNEDMCISNAVYCRPAAPKGFGKQNYTPKEEQINICRDFVDNFIRIINPKYIVAAGRTAMISLMNDNTARLREWEGRWTWYTRFGENNQEIPMFVMTHPAALIHLRASSEKDFEEKRKQVKRYMEVFKGEIK